MEVQRQLTTAAAAAVLPSVPATALVIAEIGVNHDGRLDRAIELIDAARDAGADAVKFQTFRADRLASSLAPPARYQAERDRNAADGQLAMLRSLELCADDFRTLRDHCAGLEVEFISTPFDSGSVELLANLGVKRFKIGSGDLTNLPLLRVIGRHERPVILSTGMSTDEEIAEALDTLDVAGVPEVTLMHCISRYPAPPEDLQLVCIPALRERFGRSVGYSDHSIGVEAALGARALGATIIEKHFTLERRLPGPDHAASADPAVFGELVRRLRRLETMLGSSRRTFTVEELEVRAVVRKSVVATRDIHPGERLDEDNVELLRPGTGIEPRYWPAVLERTALREIVAGEPVTWEAIT